MKPEQILAKPPVVLSRHQQQSYFENGYVICRSLLKDDWLSSAREAYERALTRSRTLEKSDRLFSLAPEHTAEAPCVYRIDRLPDQDPEFWNITINSPLADAAMDVLGPDVTYRDSMINVKPPGERGAVSWHQDFAFYPHTNVGTIQVLTALYDIPSEQGPLCVLPGTHKGTLFEHYDEKEMWAGELRARDLEELDPDSGTELECQAGDAILLHPLTVHGSKPNRSTRSRPLLNHGMNSADCRPYTAPTNSNSRTGDLLRGSPGRFARHDDLEIRLPPDWSKAYTSIFEHQQEPEPQRPN